MIAYFFHNCVFLPLSCHRQLKDGQSCFFDEIFCLLIRKRIHKLLASVFSCTTAVADPDKRFLKLFAEVARMLDTLLKRLQLGNTRGESEYER